MYCLLAVSIGARTGDIIKYVMLASTYSTFHSESQYHLILGNHAPLKLNPLTVNSSTQRAKNDNVQGGVR
jgi:hypothetical protein